MTVAPWMLNLRLSTMPRYGQRRAGMHAVMGMVSSMMALSWAGIPAFAVAADDEFISALRLLPDDAAAVVRVPNFDALCDAWDRTTLSGITDEPVLQPLFDANFGATGDVWKMVSDRVGVRPKDLYEITQGEVVAAWLAYASRRRPSAIVVVADIRGKHDEAEEILSRIDADLKAEGATRKDIERAGETVRIYSPAVKPGQLKIEQVVLSLTKDRLIAGDYDKITYEILDAIEAGSRGNMLASGELYKLVSEMSYRQLEQDSDRLPQQWKDSVVEWFAKPLEVGRIIRDVANVDRGNQVKIIDLLEQQGFDAILAAGGVAVVGTNAFDLLHRGYIHAPPVEGQEERFRLAARMLQFPNSDVTTLPKWIPNSIASVTRLNWKIEEAFWASETLVDSALDSEIFRPSIEGIRDDEDGPQIDLEKNVLPNLEDRILLLTYNTLPAGPDSDRLLLAIAVKDFDAISRAVAKAMEVEPDVFQIESVPGVEIWKVQRGEDGELDDEFFEDFGFEDEDAIDDQKPLLNTWSLAVVPKGPAMESAYLIFASHVELLESVSRRMAEAEPGDSLIDSEEFKGMVTQLRKLGSNQQSIQRMVRFRYSLRTRYELLRRGELRESDSVLTTLLRRIIDDTEEEVGDLERPNQAKWPEFETIEKYFRNAVSFVETTDEGWTLNGFLMN